MFPSVYARCLGADRTAQRAQALRRRPGPGFKACVYIACVALVIAIVLGLTLGPDKARKVSRRYDDEGAGDDERVFREGAYVRCGLLALVLAVFGLGVRLRRVAGAPTTRRLASRSIELTSHAS